ncbi:MAG: undecaprenyldiphospho-muramoylpentapeptide beta-N-acetylglucosaminyltransferase [Treponema sp.]|nr:undecaprenyldiphospho-muramoylpentapeptide beta-N-acetylglucosaminyltransferase [Treponema sp.]
MTSIAFTGGGTGGHIYPGLAVASCLQAQLPHRAFWIGAQTGMDRAIVEKAGIEFFGVPSGKLRRYVSLRNISDIFKVAAGFFAARRILKREKPALLFSKGGFASVPPCAAAASLGIPVFTHESDYSPGLATRIISRFAERIFIPYTESARFFSGAAAGKVCVSGNPIRPEFADASPAKGRAFLGLEGSERILLVLGGSSGSLEINALVRDALPELTRHYTVVHQTGGSAASGDAASPSARYKPYPYLGAEIPDVIAAAELVLSRSGAGSIWECASLHKPMVLIPLRGSGTRGDQVENARLFQEAGAAVCFTGDSVRLAELIAALANDSDWRARMEQATIARTNAAARCSSTEFIAQEITRRISGQTIRDGENHE